MGFEETFRSIALSVSRTVAFTAHAFLFGCAVILLLVVRPAFAELGDERWIKGRRRLSRRLEGLMQAAMTASAVATFVALALQTALVGEASGGQVDTSAFFSAVDTRFGFVYLMRFPILVGLVVLLVSRVRDWALAGAGDERPSPGRGWWIGWLGLSAALLATSSFAGHASVARPQTVSVVNDLVHLLAGSVWFTGIIVLALVLPDGWRGLTSEYRIQLLTPSVVRFSTVAMVSIGVVGATGVVNSLLDIGHLNDLVDTGYGRTLLIKIAFYCVILALGGVNHYFVRHRLEKARAEGRSDGAQKLFRRTIAAELLVALTIMTLTGLLTGLARTRENAPAAPAGSTSADR
ncbi:MAG: copper transport protein [Actinomycetota bacterium]|jgi:copper transport protein|nr:copper transport protein [Actinomycetota bacterium]